MLFFQYALRIHCMFVHYQSIIYVSFCTGNELYNGGTGGTSTKWKRYLSPLASSFPFHFPLLFFFLSLQLYLSHPCHSQIFLKFTPSLLSPTSALSYFPPLTPPPPSLPYPLPSSLPSPFSLRAPLPSQGRSQDLNNFLYFNSLIIHFRS